MKKIALFSDGTGNSASTPHKTNVWRAYQALDLSDGSHQIAYYDNGVGTSAFTPTAILGLAFGWGLARNVKQIYGFLCRTYDPGDEIYGFGFSRGAFTMRVAVALIASQGIVDRDIARDDRDLDRLITAAYREFRRKEFTPSLLSWFLRPVRDAVSSVWHRLNGRKPYDPQRNVGYSDKAENDGLIKFVGVWDTVDAYGFPVDELTRAWDMVVWPLSAKDRELSPRVARACHALALDEQRESFEPMLWNEAGVEPRSRLEDERLSQVWFPGVHANVGGGYPDDGLAFLALDWMIGESEKQGLVYDPEERRRITAQARLGGPLYDSRSGVGNLYRYAPRDIERLCHEQKPGLANWLKKWLHLSELCRESMPAPLRRVVEKLGLCDLHDNEVQIDRPKIHQSAFDRLRRDGNAYAPINLPRDYAYLDSQGNLLELKKPGAAASPLPETVAEAGERRRRQSYVWNKVWGRKLLYFTTLALIVCFIAYPYWVEPGSNAQEELLAGFLKPLLGTFSAVIQQIPLLIGKIPGLGFAETWATRYQSFPFVFILGLLLIAALLTWSRHVNRLLKTEMRLNWRHVTKTGGFPKTKISRFRAWLAGILEGPVYTDWIARPLRIGLEALGVLLLVALLVAVASRLFFTAADAAGWICEAEAPQEGGAFAKPFEFDPTDTCFNTGLTLEEDKTYRIELEVSDWQDKSIDADVKGWCEGWCRTPPPWYLYLFTPVRRHLLAAWYQPIARIDNKLLDRYPLALQDPKPRQEQRRLITEITARRKGTLYLYLNDAVLFTPGFSDEFYANNGGTARVTVTESR